LRKDIGKELPHENYRKATSTVKPSTLLRSGSTTFLYAECAQPLSAHEKKLNSI
jgi:hypothetical protein